MVRIVNIGCARIAAPSLSLDSEPTPFSRPSFAFPVSVALLSLLLECTLTIISRLGLSDL